MLQKWTVAIVRVSGLPLFAIADKIHSVPNVSEPTEKLVNVQIDGEWLQFPKGTRMIEACRQAGREVPHYCYHPKLTSPGNCRMCLVEMGMPPRPAPGQEVELDTDGHARIQWIPRPAIACANTVAEGMGIRTSGKLTEECRKGVMEFLLINHPLDCPICDQAGECRLQEFSVEHGSGASRFVEQKVKKPKNVRIGPRITLDDERCILCSRCIRFCQEVVEDDVLGFLDRGSHTVLTTHPDKELANNYSLNTADICPVGALTSTDFRFQMRVWFLKEIQSIDTNCGTGCNIFVHGRENKIYRITPRENNEVNSCWMPDSHRLNFHYVDSAERLTDPMIKDGRSHRVVEWKDAILSAAGSIGELEPGEVAIIASARLTNEDLFMVGRLAAKIGTDKIDIVPRMGKGDGLLIASDRNANTNGARTVLGIKAGDTIGAIRDGVREGSIKGLLVFGEDLLEAGFDAESLKDLSVLVSSHVLANPMADLSHVVFPAACPFEKRGSMINILGRLQRLNRAVEAPWQALEDWEIARDLLQALGGGNGVYAIEDVFKLMTAEVAEFAGLSLSRIGDLGVPLIKTRAKIPLLEKEAERQAKGLIVG